jgi:cobalt-zinc-cadmium efflux system protein
MSHNHEHTGRNLAITVILNGIITIGQFAGGIISGSLALISDALHNLSDVISGLFGASDRTSATKSEVDIWI